MAIRFNGVDQYAENGANFTFSSQCSISFWLRTDSTQEGDTAQPWGVLHTTSPHTSAQITFNTNENDNASTNTTALFLRFGSTQNDRFRSSFQNSTVYDGEWHHHLIVRDGTSISYYLDGSEQTLNVAENNLSSNPHGTNIPINFGCRNLQGSQNNFADADLEQFAIFSTNVDSTVRSQLQTSFPDETNASGSLIRYWPMVADVSETEEDDDLTLFENPDFVDGPFEADPETTPQGTITFDSVTPGETSVDVDFSYDESDQDGFEYRVDGGSEIDIGTDTDFEVTGLDPDTPYSEGFIEARAYNAEGSGDWFDVPAFATLAPAIPVPGNVQVTITSRTSAEVTWDDVPEADVFQVESRVRAGVDE